MIITVFTLISPCNGAMRRSWTLFSISINKITMGFFQQLKKLFLNLFFIFRLHTITLHLIALLWKINSSIFGEAVKSKTPPAGVLYRDGWIEVNGVPSHVLTWGGWIEDSLPEGKPLLVFMCGAPGVTLFYQNFLELLHTLIGIPVWTINLAGHEIPPSSTKLKLPKDSTRYNNVKAQIAHKLAFFKKYVPKDRKIYFIGHSFGSKMVLELLKDEQVQTQTERSVLLMPTIERFRETPRAQFWVFFLKIGFVNFLKLFSWIVSLMPMTWQRQIALLYFRSRGLNNTHECFLEAMVQFWQPTIFYNVRTLAYDELEAIKHLDTEVLIKQKDRMKVYFAPNDYWAPLTYRDTLMSAVPGLAVEVLDKKFSHAFTLTRAQDMAEILVKEFNSLKD